MCSSDLSDPARFRLAGLPPSGRNGLPTRNCTEGRPCYDLKMYTESSLVAVTPDNPTPDQPAIAIERPDRQTIPFVFASPHSGRDYPAEFLAASRLDLLTLRRTEDSFVDEIFRGAPKMGSFLLKALFARSYCDPNREAYELDPVMFEDPLPAFANISSPRVKNGLRSEERRVGKECRL